MAKGRKKTETGKANTRNATPKRHATQQSVNQAVWNICDIMRRGNCAGAMQYVPELTWLLFLRVLDAMERNEEQEAKAVGQSYTPSLEAPFRWCDWGMPPDKLPEGQSNKRQELQEGALNSLFDFIHTKLLPHLKKLKDLPSATTRQKVISEIMSGVERIRIDTERNFLDVCDKVHELSDDIIDNTHIFMLSQVYEGLLLKMGEKGNDGGQFFTPRQVIKAMVQVIAPQLGETVYDPSCGTGGFLAQSFQYTTETFSEKLTGDDLDRLKQSTYWGREKENLIYPIALANLVLHGIDRPNLWHGNTLTGNSVYDGLFESAPPTFDVILSNPPFGGKEGEDAQTDFDFKSSATQVLFLQHILRSLRRGGRCGIVLDEGLLFRTNEDAFVQTKRNLLDECDVWCIVSLPGGVFNAAGAGVKTNLLFFTKGQPTKKIWYYDLSGIKVGKKTPLTLQHFEDFFALLEKCGESEQSWTVDFEERKRVATKEAKPFKDEAANKKQQAAQWSEERKKRKKALKDARPAEVKAKEAALAEAETKVKELEREARLAEAKAKEIEDAVYDLKAVNPNKKQIVDERTPKELVEIIEAKGKEITQALASLRLV